MVADTPTRGPHSAAAAAYFAEIELVGSISVPIQSSVTPQNRGTASLACPAMFRVTRLADALAAESRRERMRCERIFANYNLLLNVID